MKRPLACVIALTLLLAGCQKNAAAPHAETADQPSPPTTDRAPAPDAAADAKAAPPGPQKPGPAAPLPPLLSSAMLAYVFHYDIDAPPAKVDGLLHQDEQACIAAGPTLCQVLGERLEAVGRDEVQGQLELRAEPRWLEAFRGGLATRAQNAGGKIADSTVETEDLARSIVDTEAALRSKKALRDRLQALLQRPSSDKIQDMFDVQQQLTQVQSEVDAAESELAVMHARVQMSKLTIAYRSSASLAPDSAFSPVAGAAREVVRNLMGSLAVIITLLSFLAPFGLIAGVGMLLWRRGRKRSASAAETPEARG